MIKTILIVEDEQNFHDLYEEMLEGTGCEIISAYDGYEAMEMIEETIPDVIILDMLMDMVTGDTFFMYLRNIPEYVNIPVIIISSSPERLYSHLREFDPSLIFIEKQYLTKERLLDEVEKSFMKLKSMKNNVQIAKDYCY